MLGGQKRKRYRRLAFVALLAASLFASEAVLTVWSDPAFAKNGNGNGGGNGGGNSGGNGGGNSGGNGGGNSGGNSGGNGNSNAGGNGKGKGATASTDDGAPAETQVEDPNSVLGLREAGVIRPLEDVYKVAEKQLDGVVLDAKLVGSTGQGWNYDLRVVTEDGHVHKARYDATTLALRALDGQPVE